MTPPAVPQPTPAALAALDYDELQQIATTYKAAHAATVTEFAAHGQSDLYVALAAEARRAYDDMRCSTGPDVILALLAAARQENNITSQAVANARVRRVYIERAEKAEAERDALAAAARRGAGETAHDSPANRANGTPSTDLKAPKLPEIAVAYLAGAKDERAQCQTFGHRSDVEIDHACQNYAASPYAARAAHPEEPQHVR